MRCANCDREFDERNGDCPYCGAVPDKEIKRASSFGQTGKKQPEITVDENGFYEEQKYRREWQGGGSHARFRSIRFPSGIVGSLLLAVIFLLFVFVLLPAFVFVAVALAAAWFIYRLFAF